MELNGSFSQLSYMISSSGVGIVYLVVVHHYSSLHHDGFLFTLSSLPTCNNSNLTLLYAFEVFVMQSDLHVRKIGFGVYGHELPHISDFKATPRRVSGDVIRAIK